MSVSQALDAVRNEISGCSLVAYADLSSQIVLSTSAAGNPGQERLDALSGAAVLALDGTLAEGASPLLDGAGVEKAMFLTNSEAQIFLRSPGAAHEVLICVCAPDIDFDAAMDCGSAALTRILAEN